MSGPNPEPFLLRQAKLSFYNTSPMDLKKIMWDQENLDSYRPSGATAITGGFS